MNPVTPSLDDVKREFDQWRLVKKSKRERTPLSLCLAAAKLSPHYPTHTILSHLNISLNAFKAFQKKAKSSSASAITKSSSEDPHLFSFLPFALESTPSDKGVSCQILKPDGTQLMIQTYDPLAILKAFLCCH